jgi:hypothetical protein
VLDDKWLALIKVKQIRRQFPLYGTELAGRGLHRAAAALLRRARVGVRSAAALEAP